MVEAWGAEDGEKAGDGGVYWQTIGPRFETPAEIRMIAPHADLVGMTIASECVIAGELGLEYAAICVVDNLANGLAEGYALGRGDGSRPADQRGPPARRARRRPAAPRRGRAMSAWPWERASKGSPPMSGLDRRADAGRRGGRAALRADGTIAAIGPEVAAAPGEEALDAAGAILVPPLVNGHTHAAMTLFRGSGGDLPLMPWLENESGRSRRSSTPTTSTGARDSPAWR